MFISGSVPPARMEAAIDAPRNTLSLRDAYERILCRLSVTHPTILVFFSRLTIISLTVVFTEVNHAHHLALILALIVPSTTSLLVGCDIVSWRADVSLGLNTCKCAGRKLQIIDTPVGPAQIDCTAADLFAQISCRDILLYPAYKHVGRRVEKVEHIKHTSQKAIGTVRMAG